MPGEDARRLTGDIIEESLADRSVLSEVTILETRVEPATEYHRTPWLERWTIGSPYPRSEPRRWPNASVKPSTWSTRTLGTQTSRTGISITLPSPAGFSGSPP
jgi:hypothetical protein